jgi:hypothetical protein
MLATLPDSRGYGTPRSAIPQPLALARLSLLAKLVHHVTEVKMDGYTKSQEHRRPKMMIRR